MSAGGRTSAAEIRTSLVARDRRAYALKLRTEGLTQREVAERLGVSPSRAAQLIQAALDDIEAPGVAELRQLEGERLDAWERRTTRLSKRAQSEADRIKALGVLVRISERRARLFGLDLPVRVEMSGPAGAPLASAQLPPAELAALILADCARMPELAQRLMDGLWTRGVRPVLDAQGEGAEESDAGQ